MVKALAMAWSDTSKSESNANLIFVISSPDYLLGPVFGPFEAKRHPAKESMSGSAKDTLVTDLSDTTKYESKTNARFVISSPDYLHGPVFRPFDELLFFSHFDSQGRGPGFLRPKFFCLEIEKQTS